MAAILQIETSNRETQYWALRST